MGKRGSPIPKDKVPVKLDKFIRMEANSCSREEKLREVFGITDLTDKRACNNADAQMCRWRKHPLYDEIWKDELRKQDYSDFSLARQVLRRSMKDQKDKWLAMQSAINIMNNSGRKIYGNDENTVTVQIQGMPDIGSPDDDV